MGLEGFDLRHTWLRCEPQVSGLTLWGAPFFFFPLPFRRQGTAGLCSKIPCIVSPDVVVKGSQPLGSRRSHGALGGGGP